MANTICNSDSNQKEPTPLISAGAVVLGTQQNAGKIALIRRNRYGRDISLPKGKLKKDETIEACAIREVREETGQQLAIQSYAGLTHYLAAGVPKVVFYFIMHADQADCAPKDSGEVADVIWVKPEEAIDMLTYPGDRQLLRQLSKLGVI
ncbi:MAG: 8-oxo-dGTP diphosphatase [Bradyrhizobium sp.]|nr:8-oxo-dGTP diphosphatase [Bradyrhizobium sp.]